MPSSSHSWFGDLIRSRRKAAGLTQAELGERVGRSASTVRSWEYGQSLPGEPEVLQALTEALGIGQRELVQVLDTERLVFDPTEVIEPAGLEEAGRPGEAPHLTLDLDDGAPPPIETGDRPAEPTAPPRFPLPDDSPALSFGSPEETEAVPPSGPDLLPRLRLSFEESPPAPEEEPAGSEAEQETRVLDAEGGRPEDSGLEEMGEDWEEWSPEWPPPGLEGVEEGKETEEQALPIAVTRAEPRPRTPAGAGRPAHLARRAQRSRGSPARAVAEGAPAGEYLSYVEDPEQLNLYRLRWMLTGLILVGLLVVGFWAMRGLRQAVGEIIELF